jgi:hypothetical protein
MLLNTTSHFPHNKIIHGLEGDRELRDAVQPANHCSTTTIKLITLRSFVHTPFQFQYIKKIPSAPHYYYIILQAETSSKWRESSQKAG